MSVCLSFSGTAVLVGMCLCLCNIVCSCHRLLSSVMTALSTPLSELLVTNRAPTEEESHSIEALLGSRHPGSPLT
ncbi:hypothetical protein BD626DRAFT_492061 [Schizophyllum amplum]|uniref:Uncharacterized protein n=1 Tax=Schizophyllum amplum TaxID=97359 RepID=A0A550CI84_9AGAR|nr:hypothetical protein BD626DRAFT_492061 [Auriculariopsis ampla]